MSNLIIEPIVVDVDCSPPTYQQVLADRPSKFPINVEAEKINPKKSRSQKVKKTAKKKEGGDCNSADEENEKQVVKCLTTFKIFILDQSKSKTTASGIKKKVWTTVSPDKPFPVDIQVAPAAVATTFEDFVSKVATACEVKVGNTGSIIRKSINCDPTEVNMEWSASIPRVDGFKKNDQFVIKEESDYLSWIKTLADIGGTKAGLSLATPNPKKEAAQIHQAQLLAKVALREESAKATKRKKSDEPAEGSLPSDGEEEAEDKFDVDDIKLCMRKLFREHPTNTEYDRKIPVYIHPTKKDLYFLLTHGKCQEWARALLLPTDGVTYQSLPSSIKFDSLSKKRKTSDNPELTQALDNYFRSHPIGHSMSGGFGAGNHELSSSSSDASSSQDDGTAEVGISAIKDYVNFIGLKNSKGDQLAKLLFTHHITSYKMFKSKNLDRKHLFGLGLTIGIIAKLYNNIGKFRRHLSKKRK
ncbi:hypothetical protein PCASD_09693 [Puccinia coronata f. sp. avenae]|uniref:Uncharacterized protein n=1 Tax=Puccinia coronata f. sp. avenae TaxID=200324 RepID=A0A2N5TFM1_9BASI|nr:hypothetical protein PCASD_09693 [Puccinia coronata f. sp. avenae]